MFERLSQIEEYVATHGATSATYISRVFSLSHTQVYYSVKVGVSLGRLRASVLGRPFGRGVLYVYDSSDKVNMEDPYVRAVVLALRRLPLALRGVKSQYVTWKVSTVFEMVGIETVPALWVVLADVLAVAHGVEMWHSGEWLYVRLPRDIQTSEEDLVVALKARDVSRRSDRPRSGADTTATVPARYVEVIDALGLSRSYLARMAIEYVLKHYSRAPNLNVRIYQVQCEDCTRIDVKLNSELRRHAEEVARRNGVTLSDVVRYALKLLLERYA